jgi:hypothetical protein
LRFPSSKCLYISIRYAAQIYVFIEILVDYDSQQEVKQTRSVSHSNTLEHQQLVDKTQKLAPKRTASTGSKDDISPVKKQKKTIEDNEETDYAETPKKKKMEAPFVDLNLDDETKVCYSPIEIYFK